MIKNILIIEAERKVENSQEGKEERSQAILRIPLGN
jgi:hypothetical protein